MDINRVFDLFNTESSDPNDETSLLMDFSEHPLFWISGFNKIMSNHLFFKQYTVKNFQNISPDLNIDELEKAGEELMFRKAWEYIKDFNVDKSFHIECLKTKSNMSMMNNLQVSIDFFEVLEEYEKCALLKNIKDKVEEFLK